MLRTVTSYFVRSTGNEDPLFVSRITVKMIRQVRKINITDFVATTGAQKPTRVV